MIFPLRGNEPLPPNGENGQRHPVYAVIFKAELAAIDDEYTATAARLRDRAIHQYGCREFNAVTEGGHEITISYWSRLDQIQAWKQDPQHQAAQRMGRTKWYKSYTVQVVKVIRKYQRLR